MARANQAGRQQAGDEAVSAVIGTVMLLGITAVAITLVGVLGLPALQRLQDRAALQAMGGQLGQAHAALGDLAGADASRVIPIQLPAGAIAIEDDGRVMVTIAHDGANPTCNPHVTGWADPEPLLLSYEAPACRVIVDATVVCDLLPILGLVCDALVTESVWEAFRVQGASLEPVALLPTSGASGTFVRADGGTFSRDADWMFRLSNGENDPDTPEPLVVYAQAWLSASDRIAWSTGGDVGLSLAAGALWSRDGAAIAEAGAPGLTEQALGDGGEDLVLRLPVLRGDPDGGFNDRGDHRLELRQASAALRARLEGGAGGDAYLLRMDFGGRDAQAACSALLLRNAQFPVPRWQEDPGHACEDGGDGGVRSLTYRVFQEGAPSIPVAFRVRFLQEVVLARLVL